MRERPAALNRWSFPSARIPPRALFAGATVASASSLVFFSGFGIASLGGTLLAFIWPDTAQLVEQPDVPLSAPLSGPATGSSLGDVVRELQELRTTVCPPCPACPALPPAPNWISWRPSLSLDFWAGLVLALIFVLTCRAVRICWQEYRWLRRAAGRERRAIAGEAVRFR